MQIITKAIPHTKVQGQNDIPFLIYKGLANEVSIYFVQLTKFLKANLMTEEHATAIYQKMPHAMRVWNTSQEEGSPLYVTLDGVLYFVGMYSHDQDIRRWYFTTLYPITLELTQRNAIATTSGKSYTVTALIHKLGYDPDKVLGKGIGEGNDWVRRRQELERDLKHSSKVTEWVDYYSYRKQLWNRYGYLPNQETLAMLKAFMLRHTL